MSCSNISAAEPVGPLLQQAELHKRITVDTRIRSASAQITVNERLHNRPAELLAHIGNMMRNTQTRRKCCSRFHGLESCVTGDKGKSFDPVALLKKHTAYRTAVNASAHSNKNTFFFKHNHATDRSVKKNP